MIYRQYQEQKPKKQAVFAEKHHTEIALFESAERYLKGVMNGKTTLPIKAWRSEHAKLTVEQKRLNQDYTSLKDEVYEDKCLFKFKDGIEMEGYGLYFHDRKDLEC